MDQYQQPSQRNCKQKRGNVAPTTAKDLTSGFIPSLSAASHPPQSRAAPPPAISSHHLSRSNAYRAHTHSSSSCTQNYATAILAIHKAQLSLRRCFFSPPVHARTTCAFSPIIATRYRPGPACMAEQLDFSIHAPTACYQHHSLVPKDPLINTTWPDESMTATIAKTKHFCCRCCSVLFISFPLSQVTSPHPTNAAHLYHPSLKSLRESGRVRWRAPPLQTQPKCVQTAMDATCGMSPAEAGSLGLEAASRYFISGRAELGFRESKRNNSGVAQATCQRILTLPL